MRNTDVFLYLARFRQYRSYSLVLSYGRYVYKYTGKAAWSNEVRHGEGSILICSSCLERLSNGEGAYNQLAFEFFKRKERP